MKLNIFIGISILLTACAPQVTAIAEITEAVVPVETETLPPLVATVTPEPVIPSPAPPLLSPPQPEEISLEGITDFAMLPDNSAHGELAPEFSARLLGGGKFTLSENRGKYWLVLPTAFGCGECTFSLTLLERAAPESGSDLHVLVLDIYVPDQPEYWQGYADAFGNSAYRWSVLDTPTFLDDYEIFD